MGGISIFSFYPAMPVPDLAEGLIGKKFFYRRFVGLFNQSALPQVHRPLRGFTCEQMAFVRLAPLYLA